MKSINVEQHLSDELKDPYFKELWELEEQKLAIVKQIIAYRIKNDLNQRQLAKKVGVTQQHISKIETGDFVSVMTLEKVLLAIGYTVQMRIAQLKPSVAGRIQKIIERDPVTRVKGKARALRYLDKLKKTAGLVKGGEDSVRFVRKLRNEWD